MKKSILFVIWFVLLIFGIYSVINSPLFNLVLSSRGYLPTFVLKISIVLAFINLFVYLTMKFSFAKILSYIFIFLSLISILASYYLGGRGIDPFYTFTQVCVLCSTPVEYYFTLGRLSFWLAVVVVVWKKFDDSNYLIFLFIGAEAYFLVDEFRAQPFFVFAIIAYLIVIYLVIFKKLPEYYRAFRAWLIS